jgi:hypothetical protein
MKRTLTLLLLTVLPVYAIAQTVKDIIQRHWTCQIILPSPSSDGIDTLVQHLYSIQIDESGDYTGTGALKIFSKGKEYSTTYGISGQLVISENGNKVCLTYKEGKILSKDKLPAGYLLCKEKGKLWLYRDEERPGKFFIETELRGCSVGQRVFR